MGRPFIILGTICVCLCSVHADGNGVDCDGKSPGSCEGDKTALMQRLVRVTAETDKEEEDEENDEEDEEDDEEEQVDPMAFVELSESGHAAGEEDEEAGADVEESQQDDQDDEENEESQAQRRRRRRRRRGNDGEEPVSSSPSCTAAHAVKEEVFYNIAKMSVLPDMSTRTPSSTRHIGQVYYKNTGSTWSGFTQSSNYAVQWTSTLTIKTAGLYTFRMSSDDGSKMWIDGSAVVDNDGLHGWRTKTSQAIQLSVGAHSFKAGMFERGGHAGMDVTYKGPDTSSHENPDGMRIRSSAFSCG